MTQPTPAARFRTCLHRAFLAVPLVILAAGPAATLLAACDTPKPSGGPSQ